jgi:plastocyanin
MADFSYAPACVAVDAGAMLELRNSGDAPHTFTVSETEVDVNVDAGGTDTVDLSGITPGTYEVVCTLHPQMEGALQVR